MVDIVDVLVQFSKRLSSQACGIPGISDLYLLDMDLKSPFKVAQFTFFNTSCTLGCIF